MKRRPSTEKRLRAALPPAFLILLCGYFVYHALHGDHGLLALRELETRAGTLGERAREVAARRAALESRVALLRPDSLDLDMLDEQARRQLGVLHPDEIAILPGPALGDTGF